MPGAFSSNEESTHMSGLNISGGEAQLVSRVETPNLDQLKRICMNPTISRVLKMSREVAREQEKATHVAREQEKGGKGAQA